MNRVALVMTDNILYKNNFIDKLTRKNRDIIFLIIELKFKHPNLNYKKHYERYFQLLGLKGIVFIGLLVLKNIFNKYVTSFFTSKGFTIKQIAKKNNIKYKMIADINSISTITLLKQQKISFILNSANQIYKGDILNLYKGKILNRHTSLLPNYGGIYPVFWQLLHGFKDGGVSLHWINEKIDDGQMGYSKSMFIDPRVSLFNHYKKAFEISYDLCQKALDDIKNGTPKYYKITGKKTYFSWPTKKDLEKFHDLKLKIV